MDDLTLRERIRQLSSPLAPRPTEAQPVLPRLADIRAVVFDVYGTLLVSASGDISLATEGAPAAAAIEALTALGVAPPADGEELAARLRATIEAAHAASPSNTPEVEIREIWRDVLAEFNLQPSAHQIEQLAVQYECRVNPVWPMPGMVDVLERIAGSGRQLGIISNAQFFTPLAMEALTGESLEQLGFAPDLSEWSYDRREAKPGAFLYHRCAEALAARGLQPAQTLYVGNDMRNDVWPAQQVGFRTALFAGDQRSLRLRTDDPQVAGVIADAVVTELPQLLQLLD
ncbi:MAG: haloacid dehalogenase [Planctomycetaceae bacterium]|nr:haloacid dehalogenase [Planctomycetaceae bacterium]